MLCLMTYADIKAVAPDALTPWKAENLWQLYIATSNFMDRSVDQERYRADVDTGLLNRIVALTPERAQELRSFPRRTAAALSADTPAGADSRPFPHGAADLATEPVQINLRTVRQLQELTVITTDRPMLFADMAGVLSSWGMNIVKAEAFSDDAGIIVDTFQFSDPFQTLELNPSEVDRFLKSMRDVISKQDP